MGCKRISRFSLRLEKPFVASWCLLIVCFVSVQINCINFDVFGEIQFLAKYVICCYELFQSNVNLGNCKPMAKTSC